MRRQGLDSVNSSSKNYWFLSAIFLLASTIIILFRHPSYIFAPRFWGEDAIYFETFFHADSWLGGFDAVIYPSYYQLLPRVGGFLATLVDLESAPIMTTLLGFLTLMTPIIIIFATDSDYWKTLKDKIVLSLVLIFSCSTAEIWLTSAALASIVPVVSFLILLDDNLSSRLKRSFYSFYIGVAVLTGPITLLMSPFFVLRYFYTKNKQYAIYCFILLVFGSLNIMYFLISQEIGLTSSRFGPNSGSSQQIINMFSYNMVFPTMGYFISLAFRSSMGIVELGVENSKYLIFFDDYLPDTLMELVRFIFESLHSINTIAFIVVVLFLLMALYFLFRKSDLEARLFCFFPFIYLSILTTVFSLGGTGAFRYSYVTSFIFLFCLYNQFLIMKAGRLKKLIKYILIFSITIGIAEYYPRTIGYVSDDWPVWKEEVISWRNNNAQNPIIWPYLRKDKGIWPDWDSVWYVDLNEPHYWNQWGHYKFSEEIKAYQQ